MDRAIPLLCGLWARDPPMPLPDLHCSSLPPSLPPPAGPAGNSLHSCSAPAPVPGLAWGRGLAVLPLAVLTARRRRQTHTQPLGLSVMLAPRFGHRAGTVCHGTPALAASSGKFLVCLSASSPPFRHSSSAALPGELALSPTDHS